MGTTLRTSARTTNTSLVASILSYKANVLDKLGKYDETSWNNKGVDLINLGRNDEAIICFDEALQINPNNVIA